MELDAIIDAIGVTPFHREDAGVIYCADCLDILPKIPTLTIVTDPPFNIGYHYDKHDDDLSEEEYDELIRLSCRVPSVIIDYPENLFRVSWLIEELPSKMVSWNYNANTPRQWRGICWFGIIPSFDADGQPFKNPTDRRIAKRIANGETARLYDWWHIQQVKNVDADKSEHPCQMPIEVMRKIIKITPCDIVCDPFLGSGTTALAVKQLHKQFIGIDKSELYCRIAVDRLRQGVLDL
jgi:DNA modification methylase